MATGMEPNIGEGASGFGDWSSLGETDIEKKKTKKKLRAMIDLQKRTGTQGRRFPKQFTTKNGKKTNHTGKEKR